MEELNKLLKPLWGSEKWILEGWNKITSDEKATITARLEHLFKNGLPFELKHDKLLYIYTFSLMAQLEVLGIQLPLRFEDKMQKPEFKQRMRAQLVDEIFHAIVFTKIVFLLCAPYDLPPTYNQQIETICNFIRSQDCIKVGMVVMNLVCEGLVEEVFTILYQNNIATEVFEIIIEDEHRHVCEADLYSEIGLPDRAQLAETLKDFEDILISAFSMQPQYTIALTSLLGPQGTTSFIVALHEKYIQQLKKLDMAPSEKWELLFQVAPDVCTKFAPYSDELNEEINKEIREIEMTSLKKLLMTQLSNPGDPTVNAQFNIDINNFHFFEKKYPRESLTPLMMQAVSRVLASEDSFRNFLSYKKLYQSRSAYVAVVEKLPGCDDHVGTIFFKDCHEMTASELSIKTKRAIEMMVYCYKKREQIEQEHPAFKRNLDELLYGYAHDVYPCPTPGSHGVYLSNIGPYGYTQGVSPLFKKSGLHIFLLAVERKPVWNNATHSFDACDVLPVSISADGRIFDGMRRIPQFLNEAFQTVLQEMNESIDNPILDRKTPQSHAYKKRIDEITDNLLDKRDTPSASKIIAHLFNKNKKKALDEVKKRLGDDFEIYGEKLTMQSDFKNIADNLLLDYLGFNADEAAKNAKFTKIVDKMVYENPEIAYRVLVDLQTMWFDYVDVETAFDMAYKKIAQSRLSKLAKFLPNIR